MSEYDLTPVEKRKRRREWIFVAILSLLFAALTFAELSLTKVSNSLPFVNSIFFFGLLNINIVILIALVWLVFRNLSKLMLERRRNVLGAKLKTKLVIAFLTFSTVPTLVLFVISALYINSSFDKWFSLKIQNTLQASLDITRSFYKSADQNAMHFAEHLAQGIAKRISVDDEAIPGWMPSYLEDQRTLLALDGVEFYPDPTEERVLLQKPNRSEFYDEHPRFALDLLIQAFQGEPVSVIQHVGNGDLIRCLYPVRAAVRTFAGVERKIRGVVAVNSFISVSLVNKVDEIASVFDDYRETNPLKYPIKNTYFIILVMITLVLIFVAIWLGLYMARELTVPVERLVQGAKEVGSGNLDVVITSGGKDEIAVLIDSFNRMTQDLRDNRARLTEATQDVEKRKVQLEAILANVGTGVVVVDRSGDILTFNQAAARILELDPVKVTGKNYEESFAGVADELVEVLKRELSGVESRGPEVFRLSKEDKSVAAIVTPLVDIDSHQTWGAVVVVDDISHLIKAQREMAWREVAKRIAHEIKNPLTPIKLSAQRLQRKLGGLRGKEGELVKECTETIIKYSDEMKEMVNEFSNFARLPEVNLSPSDLNEVLGEVMALYRQAHPEIMFFFKPENKLSAFAFDRDQMKRVFTNLLDNAVAAFVGVPIGRPKKIDVETHFHERLQMAVASIQDNGVGMSEEVRTRVFEPDFSTKVHGTGLGLAIAKRIINDHGGFIRVYSTLGEGTRFLIELPTKETL